MKEVIGNRQIVFLVFSGVVGLSLSIPKDFGMYAGTGGWTVAVINTFLILIIGSLIIKINMHFEQLAIYEYCELITGKLISSLVMLIYLIRFLLLASLVTRALLQVVRSTILEKTPFWPLALCFLLCAYYAASRGLKSLSYICEFYILIVVLLGTLTIFTMLTKGELINLRPFFVLQDIDIYFKESFRNVHSFLGLDILLFVPLNKIQNKQASRALLISVLAIAFFYIASFEATVAIAGINDTILYDDVFMLAVRRVEVRNLELLRRLDGIAVTNFVFAVLMMVALDIYCSGIIFSHYFKRSKSRVLNFNISCAILSTFVFVTIICIPNSFVLREYFSFSYKLLVLTSFIIPLLLFLAMRVKHHEKSA